MLNINNCIRLGFFSGPFLLVAEHGQEKIKQYYSTTWSHEFIENLVKLCGKKQNYVLPPDITVEAYNIGDYIFILFASQLLVMALIGLMLANKHLFLFLVNLELLYLAGSFMFAVFGVYWLYEPKGFIYSFLVIVLAGAESVIGFALLIVLHRRGVKLKFFDDKKSKLGYLLAVIPKDNQYANVIAFLLFIFFLLTLIYYILYKFVPKAPTKQKGSSFECGFEPNGDARMSQHIHFYTIALLFLLFDLELMFLIPWVLSLPSLSSAGRLVMLIFFVILCVGFAFEWEKHALDFMLFEEEWARAKREKNKERQKALTEQNVVKNNHVVRLDSFSNNDKNVVSNTENLELSNLDVDDDTEVDEAEVRNALKTIARIQHEQSKRVKAEKNTD